MTRLLISVRSALEAETALAGGADLIDIKEPARGPLGRAEDEVVRSIVAAVAGRRPLSLALGELLDVPQPVPPQFTGWVKIGLAGAAEVRDWEARLGQFGPGQPLVAGAYADWQRAAAPPPEAVLFAAVRAGCAGLLLDTWNKDGSTLLDWSSLAELTALRSETQRHGLTLAFAGSLRAEHIGCLLPLSPDLLAFRGAACRHGERCAEMDLAAVRRLAELIHAASWKLTNRTPPGSRAATLGNQASTSPSLAQSARVEP
jgi:hypothetical protein